MFHRHTRRRTSLLALVCLLVLGSATIAVKGANTAVSNQNQACQSLFAPAYYWYDRNFFPQWDQLINANSKGMTVVVGLPLSRGQADPAYSWVIQQARANGIVVLAYVQTYFGQRDPAEMARIIEQIEDWYQVDGIFIDEVMPDHNHTQYYRDIVAEARKYPDQLVVINPGGNASQEYVEMADAIVTFEGNVNQYIDFEVPKWMYDYPAERFIHLVHSASSDDLHEILTLSRERNVSMVYVTDDRPENAYHLIPTYWQNEVDLINSQCPS